MLFSPHLYYLLSPARPFLPFISPPTSFPNRGLMTIWVQLLITSHYYLPSTQKDWSTMRAELAEVSNTDASLTYLAQSAF